MSTVKITKADFTSKVEQGWKREQLIEHYGIRNSDVTAILKQLGLTIKKTHKPRFELIDDEDSVTTTQEVDTQVQATSTQEATKEVAQEVAQVEDKPTRTRRSKAQIEADKAAAEAAKNVEIQPDTEAPATVQDSAIGEAKVVEEPQVEAFKQVPQTQEVDVMKATEDVQTSFNIPNGVGAPSNIGSEDAFNAQPTGGDVQQENPFLKAWGSPQ